MFTDRWILTAVCCFMFVGSCGRGFAQDSAETTREERIENLIRQLESPRFSDRARATQDLQRFGADAVEPLEQIIRSGSYEAADRALEILKRNFQSDDPLLADPAKEALQRIAETEGHPRADAAQRLLAPEPAQSSPNARGIRPPFFPGVPINRNIKIQVQVKSVNGRKDIQVTENGRKFRFTDEGDGIAVERPDDQGGVKKEKYKDEAELKSKDPDAHKIYQRYSKGRGNQIQIQIGQLRGLPGQRIQIQPGVPGGGPRIQLPPRLPLQPRIQRPQLPPAPAEPPPEPAPAPPKKPKLDDAIEV